MSWSSMRRNLLISFVVVLLAVPLEIDFGDKAGLTASHRAFLCAKQDRGYSTKASWSRGASDPVVGAFGGSSPATWSPSNGRKPCRRC